MFAALRCLLAHLPPPDLAWLLSWILLAFSRQYLDLHDMFVRWVNLPQCKDKQLDYSQFLKALGRFEDIPEQEKVCREPTGGTRTLTMVPFFWLAGFVGV